MNIGVVGTGYVGSVTGACFAKKGNKVICVDNDAKKVEAFSKGIVPLHEPGLPELVEDGLQKKTLSFTTDIKGALDESDIIFIAVGTPSVEDGSADLSHVLTVARSIGQHMTHPLIVVDKSTVPVGTAELVRRTIASELEKRGAAIDFDVASNPEFLAQGSAVKDFLKPSRVVVGSNSEKTREILKELYDPFMHEFERFYKMDPITAETVKYASNSFLAGKISMNNELANICQRVGADFEQVRKAMGADPRIGKEFMYAGPGFGGSCFPKDVKALVKIAADHGYDAKMFKQILDTNDRQKHILADMAVGYFGDEIAEKTLAVWGLAFKANTDDMRESPALTIINDLIAKGAKIQAYDPEAMGTAKWPVYFGENPSISYFENQYDVLKGADALLVITEWDDFKSADFEQVKNLLKTPLIFDGRLLYDPKKMKEIGFTYRSIGRGLSSEKS